MTIEDIQKLTTYQLEVFKDVFATKQDLDSINQKINGLYNHIDGLIALTKNHHDEMAIIKHQLDRYDQVIPQR